MRGAQRRSQRIARPSARSMSVRRISGRPISAVGSSLAMRVNSAMPSASDLTDAGAIVRLLALEVGLDVAASSSVRNVLATSTSARRQRPLARVDERQAGVKDDRPSRTCARSCASASSRSRACRSARAVAVRDLVGADDQARRDSAAATARALASASRSAVAAGRLAGQRRFVDRRRGDRRTAGRGARAAPCDSARSRRAPARAQCGAKFAVVFTVISLTLVGEARYYATFVFGL